MKIFVFLFVLQLFFSFSQANEKFSCDNFDSSYSFLNHFEAYLKDKGDMGMVGARLKRQKVYNDMMRSFYRQIDQRAQNPNSVQEFIDLIHSSYAAAFSGSRRELDRIGVTATLIVDSNTHPVERSSKEYTAAELAGKKLSEMPFITTTLQGTYFEKTAGFNMGIKFARSPQNYNVNTFVEEAGRDQENPPISATDDVARLRPPANRRLTIAGSAEGKGRPNLAYLTCKYSAPEEATPDGDGSDGSANAETLSDDG